MEKQKVKMKNGDYILSHAKDQGFNGIEDAIIAYRKKGFSVIEIRNKLGMTQGQYDNFVKSYNLVNIKTKPESMDVFSYCDSIMKANKRMQVIKIAKKKGYSTFSELVWDMAHEMPQNQAAKKLGVTPPFLNSVLRRVIDEKAYRDGTKKRPSKKERKKPRPRVDNSDEPVKLCSFCKKNPVYKSADGLIKFHRSCWDCYSGRSE